jgi:hypothetical protein
MGYKTFWNNFLNFIIYNMYSIYLHGLFLNFFIWNIKISNIFFYLFFQVDSGQFLIKSDNFSINIWRKKKRKWSLISKNEQKTLLLMLLFQIVGDSYFSLSLVKKKRKYFGIVKRISSVRWGDNISETWKYTLVSSLNIIYDASHHPS